MIKAVIFDFFGVLVTEGFKLFRDTYLPDDKEKKAKALQLVNKHDAGLISQADYVKGLAKLAGVDEAEVRAHMSNNSPNTKLLGYIKKELKPRFKIGVLSNSGDDYISQILSAADAKMFDDIVLSYRHGMTKPDKQIFNFAAKRLGVAPEEVVLIDDSKQHCFGAANAGMKAILYEDFEQMKAELEQLIS